MPSISVSVTGQALLHGALDTVTPGSASVSEVLRSSDAALANLEATVKADGAWPTKTKTLHLTDEGGVASLRALGFDVLSHANNHAFDLGPPGIAQTRAAVERAGMHLTGSGADRAEAERAARIHAPGGTVAVLSVDLGPQPEIVYASGERSGINPLRVRRQAIVPHAAHALLRGVVEGLGDDRRAAARTAVGYQAGPATAAGLDVFGTEVLEGTAFDNRFVADPGDFDRLRSSLEDARTWADLVVVALHNHHWDADWTQTPAFVTELGRSLIDAGADLIVGTGSPVLQGMSFHRGKPILAGLGNFIFHTRRSEIYDERGVDVWTGIVCRCVFDLPDRTCSTLEVLPVAVGRPAAAPGLAAPAPSPLLGEDAQLAFARLIAGLTEADRARVTLLAPGEF
jgi:poly-gamma-glutamate capsule biosynthesis protein CapA/YwtB (metallophosphatase superfamily)